MRRILILRRVEGGAIALLAATAVAVAYPAWWWVPLAGFVLFDLSALGYLRSPASGAVAYNAVHTYVWPALLAATAFVVAAPAPPVSAVCGIAAGAWAFHVGVDRALGYGLKLPDAFTHTDLGWIGKDHGRDRP